MGEIGSVEIVIKGGRPWGFTLQGGAESRSAVTVAQIDPMGKADRQGSLKVGDHVLKINDVQCFSLADATQLIDCAFRTLTVHIWRSKNAVAVPNNTSREKYRSNNSRTHYRQICTENDNYRQNISLPVDSTYYGDYGNLPSMRSSDISHNQSFVSPCHSRQSSQEWVQYDSRDVSSLDDDVLSSYECSSQSLKSDRSAQVNPQDHYEANDSSNRHLRSPRNLTKDSGYETCAQAEHDYVNLEWITNASFAKRNTAIAPPQGYQAAATADVYSSRERPHNRHARSGSLTSEKNSHQSSSTSSLNFPYNDHFSALKNFSTSSSKYSESYTNLYSSTESLSSRASKPDSVHLRSSKSSLSLMRNSRGHAYDHQQISTSCQYSFVSPAQSTPNLNYCNKMVPQRISKKISIYEELASKSGFDFSPMVQHHRLPFHEAVTKGAITNSHFVNANEAKISNFAMPSETCDKTSTHNVYRNQNESLEDANQVFRKNKSPVSIPPPVPARDSSLRYRTSSAHEKFPSWPVTAPVENEMNCSSVHSSGYRSNSWTEQTGYVKDFDGFYSRPKNNFQISAQHLHPVQERNHKNNSDQTAPAKSKPLTKRAIQYFSQEDPTSVDISFNMLSKHLDSESSYQKCEKYINDHSPPERDLISPAPLSDEESVLTYIEKYDSNEYFQQSSNLYENVRRDGNHSPSTTPLLDRLRLERKDVPNPCVSYRNIGPKSQTSTYISSNSSSQETLKRHNSFSDLSSVHTCTRNDSPSLESEIYSINDENLNKELSKHKPMACSTEYLSASETSTQSSKTKIRPWPKSCAVPYTVTNGMYEQKLPFSPGTKTEIVKQEPKYSRRDSGNDINYHNRFQTENHREKASLSSYSSAENSSDELSNALSKGTKTNSPYVQNEKRSDISNATKVITSLPQTVHPENFVHRCGGQNRRTLSVPENTTPRYVSNHSHAYHFHPREPSITCSKNNRTETAEIGNRYNQDLKALQKQAVLSFYHRQTMASKSFSEKKARSSSFSHSHETSLNDLCSFPVLPPPPPISHKRRIQSSSSFSEPFSQVTSCKPIAESTRHEDEEDRQFERQQHFQEKPTSTTSFSSQTEKHFNGICNNSSVSALISLKVKDEHSPRKSDVVNDAQQHTQVASVTKEYINGTSGDEITAKSPQEQASGRKALFQKTYSSNKSAVVKVISSNGETVAQNVIIKNCGKSLSKPQVPPKRIHKAMLVPPTMSDDNFSPNISVVNNEEEEEELLNMEIYHDALLVKATSSSPDLPLPPPPLNTEHGAISEDDPFPPPPDPLDILHKESKYVPPYSNENASTILMEDENHQFSSYSIALNDISKIVNHIPDCKTQETDIPIEASPNEKNSESLSLLLNETINSSSPVNHELSTSLHACENEAIYVNLPFQLEISAIPTASSVPASFSDVTSPVSVTNIGTQTSENTPALQRKNKISHLVSMYEDKQTCIPTTKKGIKLSSSSENTQSPITVSSKANEISTNGKRRTSLIKDIGKFNVDSCASGGVSVDKSIKSLSDKINLPITCPYFTTSEPKAKLLTRYYHSFHSDWMDQTDIEGQKDDLVESITKKLNIMRLEQTKIKEEVEQNEELGKDVRAKIEKLAKPGEVEKYKVHVDELEKIVHILLSLSGRLTRAENALHILPKEDQSEEKILLEDKKNKLTQQLDEALQLKENIDRRSYQVSLFLNNYLSKEDYADYEHFIQMKPKLLVDSKEIDDNIKLGEEQLLALRGTFQGNPVKQNLVNNNGDLPVLGKE